MAKILRIAEYRTLNADEKALEEQRDELVQEMRTIVDAAKAETRALNEEEVTRYNDLKTQISNIDATLEAFEEQRTVENIEPTGKKKETRTQEEINNEELRSIFSGKAPEQRSTAMNTGTDSEGGYVVNSVLAKEIINILKDRSNVYKFFNGTSVKGNYKIPKKTSQGQASWVDENPSDDPSGNIATLELIELGQHRLYRESAITKQMINVQELDLQSFIKEDIAESMIDSIEEAIFNGTGTKQPTGIISGIKAANKITLDTRGSITVDHLKKAKAKIKKGVVKKARWFMNSETFLEIDLLKDADGRPLLQPNPSQETDYILLGLPVELTDALSSPTTAGAKCLMVLATPAAYHTNTQEQLALYVYNDSVYTRRGLVGYGADMYLDGKTKDDQQLVGIFNKSA